MKVKISQLKQDSEFLSIRKVNSFVVSRYRQAVRSGAVFPPILIDAKTNVIISGNHRYDMYLKEFGEDHEIEVIKKNYKNRAAMLKDFALENATHGRPLEGFEMRQLIQKMANENIKAEEVAKILNIPVQKVKQYGDMTVVVIGRDKSKEMRPVKRGLEHMAGKRIHEEVYEEHKAKDYGITCFSQANQLRRWIENDLINKEDERSMKELELLMESLQRLFS